MSQTTQVIASRVLKPAWQKYGTPVIVVALAAAVIVTVTRNWNGWEGAKIKQATNDAYVQGDLTPLSTKISGIVREVEVNDYQIVHKGDLLVQLDDADYRAQTAQAAAAVEDEFWTVSISILRPAKPWFCWAAAVRGRPRSCARFSAWSVRSRAV